MTLKALEILVIVEGREKPVGTIKLNGPYSTELRSVKLVSTYQKKLANMELLTKGRNYLDYGLKEYLEKLEDEIKEILQLPVLIKEKKYSKEKWRLLEKQFSYH